MLSAQVSGCAEGIGHGVGLVKYMAAQAVGANFGDLFLFWTRARKASKR